MSRKTRRLANKGPNQYKLAIIRQKVALLASYAKIRNDSAIAYHLRPYKIYLQAHPPLHNISQDHYKLGEYFRLVTQDLSEYAESLRKGGE